MARCELCCGSGVGAAGSAKEIKKKNVALTGYCWESRPGKEYPGKKRGGWCFPECGNLRNAAREAGIKRGAAFLAVLALRAGMFVDRWGILQCEDLEDALMLRRGGMCAFLEALARGSRGEGRSGRKGRGNGAGRESGEDDGSEWQGEGGWARR